MTDNQNVKARLKTFIKSRNMTISHFETTINVSNGYVNSISKSIGGEKLESISKVYPELNREWLLYGTGDMVFREKPNRENAIPIDPTNDETVLSKAGMQFIPNRDGSFTMLTPHVTEFARAGYLGRFDDDSYVESLPPFPIQVSEVHRGVYRSFTVVGESMDNGLRGSLGDGDIVTGRLIQRHLWSESKLHLRKVNFFIINHIDGILVKEIIEHNLENKTITVRSLNPDKDMYPDEVIGLDQVREIYNVVYRSEKM